MTTIICPNDDCIHNGKGYKCKCKKISLSSWNVATVNMGRQDYWVCKNYEKSEEIKKLEERLTRYLETRGNKGGNT